MIAEDWDMAIKMSRVRSTMFPEYEQEAVKIFNLVSEDEENDILKFMQEGVKVRNLGDFHNARLIMVLLAKLGKFLFFYF